MDTANGTVGKSRSLNQGNTLEEINTSLLNMPKDYALGHCVAKYICEHLQQSWRPHGPKTKCWQRSIFARKRSIYLLFNYQGA